MPYLLLFCLSLFWFSCSVIPDLSDPAVFTDANQSAVDLSTLERKFMYGMFYLYVDQEGEPFTGWVKSNHDAGTLKQLGFLQKGRKEGVWMDLYSASGKQSDIYWTEDRMEGPFTVWHQNGNLKVVGQTKDGEVDGSWAEYYPDGQLAYRSTNKMGHLVDIRVWKPDGSICQESNVVRGNGSFLRYFEDGSIEHKRVFENGVETSREIFNQR
jgi:antitoxin component YwqK of YwqJK toxin-antitoxin module